MPVLLIGFTAPANWGPDYKREFDRIYPELAAKYETLFIPSFFAALTPNGDIASAQEFLQSDGLHPNPKGVSLLVDAIGPVIIDLAKIIR